jgi:hypothetical protein
MVDWTIRVFSRASFAAFLCPEGSRRLLADLDHQSEAEIPMSSDGLD